MFRNYILIAFRTLLRHKTYAVLNILGLALGLAGGVLIYLFVHFHLSTDTFHPNADRIFRVVMERHSTDGSVEYEPGTAVAMGRTLQQDFVQVEQTAFSSGFYTPPTLSIPKANDQVDRYVEKSGVVYANTGFLQLFSFRMLEGDLKTALSEPNQVVLTRKLALKYFGNTPALGKTIRLNQASDLKVTGVVSDYTINTDLKADVLISLPTHPNYQVNDIGWGIGSLSWTFVQLPANYNHRQIDAQMAAFVEKHQGKEFAHWRYHLQPLSEMHFDERYGGYLRRPMLWALCLIGIFLVGMACINFINLATAQALRRAKEVGIRKVMGGTPRQVFWQMMAETACLTFFAAALAWLAASLLLPLLNQWLRTPLSMRTVTEPTSLLFLFCLLLTVVFLAGAYPALMLSRFDPARALKNQLGTQPVGGLSLRRTLVVTQLVLSQGLMISALVVMHQMEFFQKADMGFRRDAIVSVPLPDRDPTKREAFRHAIRQLPEAGKMSYYFRPPATPENEGGYVKFNHREQSEPFLVRSRWGDDQYVELYGLRLLAGRNLMERDTVTEFIVNEEFVKRLGFTDYNAVIGKSLYEGNAEITGTIVGVVRDFHQQSLQNPIEPCVIYSHPSIFRQAGIRLNTRDLPRTLQSIQSAWVNTFPNHVFKYEFVDEKIARLYEKETLIAKLTRLFTGVAILICCLGFYGLVSFMASHKTKEIGIRKVLGASVPDILMLFGKEFIALILLSFLIAAPLAGWLMHHWLQGFAYRVELSGSLFALNALLVSAIVLLTVGFQTVKAALANPVKSLRTE
jgi:putative ABC transport system permease protein